ncbi:hypothetical protein [Lentilactobacillus parakefiri]|uniref:Uncharacterized protein n=1 Tax=Lentilactobacillus parakefiri TaxID=152332 RepID=A0A269YEK3_9LACO|nr:hypothetical protein [Lentilactobacillus parakefiri]PAK83952.1 hypothetical protein B8W98_05805 [Lentilactobacillus parakefiri]PAL00939.1 hypothetical protein B8W96_03965 [Lentilactobacillus parakefiri]TDG95220.1 hypothetical protein C5L28_001394 [Lentilactobacillus parakefiri]GAW72252.1 hypothetical protein LPKJCM_01365 [Lentilactobacillus parakefiri]
MKKQTVFYALSLAALAASTYIVAKSDRKHETFLAAIIKDTKQSAALKGFKYIGSWSILPATESTAIFHFGFNYLNANGDRKAEAFWVDQASQQVVKHQIITL